MSGKNVQSNAYTQSNVQIRNTPLGDNPSKEVKQGHSANEFHSKRIEQIVTLLVLMNRNKSHSAYRH